MTSSVGLRCIGCGALIQTEDAGGVGYLPAEALAKQEGSETLYCQRCFRLRHYNEIAPVSLTDADFRRFLTDIAAQDTLVVNVVDIFDFTGSLISSLHRLTGENDLLLVANKRDVLPRSLSEGKILAWLREQAALSGLKPKDILLVSAKKSEDISTLMVEIERYRRGRDVYVVGATNVGKSTLVNAIIRRATGSADIITTSRFPGTTLDRIEIPLDEESALIDTPGIIQSGQMAHRLAAADLKYSSPRKELKPRTYQLNSGQTLFFGGLARFDFISDARQGMTAYFDNELMIHRTKLEGATDFYERHAGGLLLPVALDKPDLVRREFSVKGKSDLVFAGLGWVRVAEQARVAAWVPEGVDVSIREAMI